MLMAATNWDGIATIIGVLGTWFAGIFAFVYRLQNKATAQTVDNAIDKKLGPILLDLKDLREKDSSMETDIAELKGWRSGMQGRRYGESERHDRS